MEGDVIGGLMRWQAGLWIAGAAVGAVALMVRAFASRLMREIDARFERIDALAHDISRVDGDLKRLIAELPIHYQRREDAIREYTVINVKLDRLYELMLRGERHE